MQPTRAARCGAQPGAVQRAAAPQRARIYLALAHAQVHESAAPPKLPRLPSQLGALSALAMGLQNGIVREHLMPMPPTTIMTSVLVSASLAVVDLAALHACGSGCIAVASA